MNIYIETKNNYRRWGYTVFCDDSECYSDGGDIILNTDRCNYIGACNYSKDTAILSGIYHALEYTKENVWSKITLHCQNKDIVRYVEDGTKNYDSDLGILLEECRQKLKENRCKIIWETYNNI